MPKCVVGRGEAVAGGCSAPKIGRVGCRLELPRRSRRSSPLNVHRTAMGAVLCFRSPPSRPRGPPKASTYRATCEAGTASRETEARRFAALTGAIEGPGMEAFLTAEALGSERCLEKGTRPLRVRRVAGLAEDKWHYGTRVRGGTATAEEMAMERGLRGALAPTNRRPPK